MKNIIKNSLVVVVVVLLSTLFANANSSLSIYNDEAKTTLKVRNVKQGNEIFVKDAFNNTLYSETIENSGVYTKNFDLTKLPDGAYYFEIEKALEIRTIHFTVQTALVEFNEENDSSIFKPFITLDEYKVTVSKLSLNKQPLEVKIYFENNGYELIHSETLVNAVNYNRAYILNKEKKGNYRIVTKTEGRTFVDNVKI